MKKQKPLALHSAEALRRVLRASFHAMQLCIDDYQQYLNKAIQVHEALTTVETAAQPKAVCRVGTCERPAHYRGLCVACYKYRSAKTDRGRVIREAMLPVVRAGKQARR